METVTVKGEVYQIDTLYFCTEKDRFGYVSGNVRNVSGPQIEMNNTDFTWYSRSLEIIEPELIGTIEDAPLELEDGEWYMCESLKAGYTLVAYWDGAAFSSQRQKNGDSIGYLIDSNCINPLHKIAKG